MAKTIFDMYGFPLPAASQSNGGLRRGLAARMAMFAGKRGGIPSGWVEVKYLQSSGTQAIPIDFQINIGEDVRIKYIPLDNSSNYAIWSNRPYSSDITRNSYSCFALTSGVRFDYRNGGAGTISAGTMPAVSKIAEFKAVGEKLYYNGNLLVTATKLAEYSVIGDLCLFASTGTADGAFNNFAKIKLYSFSVGERLSLVPVKNAETGEGAMCDILTGEIYHNSGSGSFVCGQEV